MLLTTKVIAATMLLLAAGAGAASGATPALASSGHPALASSGHQVCDEGVPLECLNAWNGGPSIRTYTPTVSNNNFTIQGVNRCNNGDYTTTNCPITGNPSGLYIYQIKYAGGGKYNGDCLGDNTGNLPRAMPKWSAATTPAIRGQAAARPPSSSRFTATVTCCPTATPDSTGLSTRTGPTWAEGGGPGPAASHTAM